MGLQFMQAIPNDGDIKLMQAENTFSFSVEMMLNQNGYAGIQFGIDNKGAGFAVLADSTNCSVNFMQLKNNSVYIDRGLKNLGFETGQWIPLRVEYDGEIVRIWFNNNPLDTEPWPKFEFALKLPGRLVGTDAGRNVAQFRNLRLEQLTPGPRPKSSYTNPVTVGADPDILIHKGVYYLYNRVPNDPKSSEDAFLYADGKHADMDRFGDSNALFRVSTSTNLVNWSHHTPIFFRDSVLQGAFCMSPNVFYKDGLFYLLFAAGRIHGNESFHVFYAVADSPMGPFTMRTQEPLHPYIQEIGGMPFIDEDGECYITYVRFDRGNHIWLQHLEVKNGIIKPDDATIVKILSPRESYEVDEYGRIVEGGVLIKHNGLYYMIYADGSYLGHYGESYAVAENIYGPYIRYPHNPILHHNFQVDGTGDGIVIYSADRSEMFIGYHCHISTEAVEPRMTCIDRMKFIPDPKGGPDILTIYGPTITPQPIPFIS